MLVAFAALLSCLRLRVLLVGAFIDLTEVADGDLVGSGVSADCPHQLALPLHDPKEAPSTQGCGRKP